MTPRVEWAPSMPAEVRAAVEPVVARWLDVLPSWVHVLTVCWNDSPDGRETTVATMESRPQYREAYMTLGGAWLTESPTERERTVQHELAHLPTAALDDLFTRIVKHVKRKNPALAADIEEQWRQAMEGATCDIAAAFSRARRAA